MIRNIFSTPIYGSSVKDEKIYNEIENVIQSAEFENLWQPDNDTASTTFIPEKETNIIQTYDMQNIGAFILYSADKYLQQTKQKYVQESLSIEQSWINIFKNNQLIGTHEHGYQPNMLSGCYYHKVPKNSGKIVFKSPNPFVISFPNQSPDYCTLYEVEPTEGMILLFPSWLLHKVEPNRSGDTRCSFAFNVSFDYTFYQREQQ